MIRLAVTILVSLFCFGDLYGQDEDYGSRYSRELQKIEETSERIERMIPNYDPEELRNSLFRFFTLYGEPTGVYDADSAAIANQNDLAVQYDFMQQKMETWVSGQRAVQDQLSELASDYRNRISNPENGEKDYSKLNRTYRRLLKEEKKNREEFRRIQLSIVRMLQRRIEWEDDQFFLNSVFDYLNSDVKPRIQMMEAEKDSLEGSRQRLESDNFGLVKEIQSTNNNLFELRDRFDTERLDYERRLEMQKQEFDQESGQILAEIAKERRQAELEIDGMEQLIADRLRITQDTISRVQRVSDSLQAVAVELKLAVRARKDSLLLLQSSIASLEDTVKTKDKMVAEIKTEATSLRDYLYYGTLLLLGGIVIATAVTNGYLRRKKVELQLINRRLNGQHSKLEILLRELHHRVKNNLQMVASMLNLQARQVGQDESRRELREARGRVQAMGLIHDKLYQSDNVTKVNLSEYIRELVEGLQSSYGMDDESFRCSLEVQNITMETDRATPIGLIINELVTNCFKHAYVDHPNPELFVNFYRVDDNRLKLVIKDNGKGMELDASKEEGSSFGLKMVHLLVEELEADLRIENKQGLSYHLEFDMNRKAA